MADANSQAVRPAETAERPSPEGPTRVSIVIPVYNELQSVEQALQRVIEAPMPPGCEKEIIVVDDGSTDGTTALLQRLHADGRIRFHATLVNFGKGAALRVGFQMATGKVVLVQDGDLEYDPRDYVKVLTPLVEGRAEVVYGSRFLGEMRGMVWQNLVANKLLTFLANLLYGARITDEATAYKAFRRDVLERIQLRCHRFEFCPEVTAKVRKLGIPITEVPIRYAGRTVEQGKKIRWRDGIEAVWTLLRHRF